MLGMRLVIGFNKGLIQSAVCGERGTGRLFVSERAIRQELLPTKMTSAFSFYRNIPWQETLLTVPALRRLRGLVSSVMLTMHVIETSRSEWSLAVYLLSVFVCARILFVAS